MIPARQFSAGRKETPAAQSAGVSRSRVQVYRNE